MAPHLQVTPQTSTQPTGAAPALLPLALTAEGSGQERNCYPTLHPISLEAAIDC